MVIVVVVEVVTPAPEAVRSTLTVQVADSDEWVNVQAISWIPFSVTVMPSASAEKVIGSAKLKVLGPAIRVSGVARVQSVVGARGDS